MKPRYQIIQGDALTVLRTQPDESVHCAVTSPPYFGLREYGIPPIVFGGDAICSHVWGAMERGRRKDLLPADVSQLESRVGVDDRQNGSANNGGKFCQLCDAWLGCYGSEPNPDLFVAHTVEIFRELRRVLRSDGTVWLNLGDSYANNGKWGGQTGGKHRRVLHGAAPVGRNKKYTGLKPKDLIGIPWRCALALQADGWFLRSDIVWSKPNPMPSSVQDRPTTSHEYVFLLSKSARYYCDVQAIAEIAVTGNKGTTYHKGKTGQTQHRTSDTPRDDYETRQPRSVWTISTKGYKKAHFATMPVALAERCIKAATSEHGVCSQCGAPWRRQVHKVRVATRPGTNSKVKVPSGWNTAAGSHDTLDGRYRASANSDSPYNGHNGSVVGNRDPLRHVTRIETIGWKPSCECDAPVGNSVVLDPFNGAATTGVAALKLGCDYLGIEPNPEYIKLSHERLRPLMERLF